MCILPVTGRLCLWVDQAALGLMPCLRCPSSITQNSEEMQKLSVLTAYLSALFRILQLSACFWASLLQCSLNLEGCKTTHLYMKKCVHLIVLFKWQPQLLSGRNFFVSLFYLDVLKSFFLKMSMDGFLVYFLVKAARVCVCVNVPSAAWSLEVKGKGILCSLPFSFLLFFFSFLSFSFLFTFEGWVELR